MLIFSNQLGSSSLTSKSHVIIFGSSQGLLSFFTSFAYPHCICRGYEVLPALHEVSTSIRKRYNLKNVHFYLEDMMNADVSSASVIVLTSLCWDVKTRKAVALKLSQEVYISFCKCAVIKLRICYIVRGYVSVGQNILHV